jgi:N6-adenosine-specific RNA methylase IME4
MAGFHRRTEFVLFGYRGKLEMFPHRKAIPACFAAKSPYHSAKPDEFYELVAPMGEKRIDIFARKERLGWDVWGNEVNGATHLDLLEEK